MSCYVKGSIGKTQWLKTMMFTLSRDKKQSGFILYTELIWHGKISVDYKINHIMMEI